nr:hypothetical protein [Corynebacterium lactis]
MSAPWLHETREWKGQWWIPEDPENIHSGILTYSPELGLELVLIGGFIDKARKQVGPNTWTIDTSKSDFPVIHGAAGGKRITLFDAFPKHTASYGTDALNGPSEQTISASTALVGIHAKSPDDECFVRADVAIEDLEGWSATYAINRVIPFDNQRNRPTGAGTVKLEMPEDLEANLGLAKITLTHQQLLPTIDYMRVGSRGRVQHTPILKVETDATVCLETLLEYISALQDLLALATGRECAVLWMNVFEPRPIPEEPTSWNNYANEVAVYRKHRTLGSPLEKATAPNDFFVHPQGRRLCKYRYCLVAGTGTISRLMRNHRRRIL